MRRQTSRDNKSYQPGLSDNSFVLASNSAGLRYDRNAGMITRANSFVRGENVGTQFAIAASAMACPQLGRLILRSGGRIATEARCNACQYVFILAPSEAPVT